MAEPLLPTRVFAVAAQESSEQDGAVSILLYNNSPDADAPPVLPAGATYRHAERIEGVAGAYNHALLLAPSEGCGWLLTLDQNTRLPDRFLVDMSDVARSQATNPDDSLARLVF